VISNFTDADVPDQTGKTFFITGANTGLGFEATRVLAPRGARVLMGCRSAERAAAAETRIREEHPAADVNVVSIDLGDLASIAAAAQLVAQEPRLDGLLNNAGIMFPPKTLTKDGFESQLGVNHLGAFALTGHLLSKLEDTPESRVVAVSSNGHKPGKIHFDDLNAEKSYNKYRRYFQSKLANLMFTYELDRRLRAKESSTISVAAHPGGSMTELGRHLGLLYRVMEVPMTPFLNTSEAGAWPLLLAVASPGVEGGPVFRTGETR
jgi:NAD(P)-dependent dehydrogenase (short-subunit alcohol dehydrogenase family)